MLPWDSPLFTSFLHQPLIMKKPQNVFLHRTYTLLIPVV